jgi:hypothetical protein
VNVVAEVMVGNGFSPKLMVGAMGRQPRSSRDGISFIEARREVG